jgi:hypothetical protein
MDDDATGLHTEIKVFADSLSLIPCLGICNLQRILKLKKKSEENLRIHLASFCRSSEYMSTVFFAWDSQVSSL